MTRRFKHNKRGSTYRLIGLGAVQCDQPLRDCERVAIYRDEADGRLWARRDHEFVDGRFTELPEERDVFDDIAHERLRQVVLEGFSPAHDDGHDHGQLAAAAASYAFIASFDEFRGASSPPVIWPWAVEWWKSTTPRRDLVKAAALIVAEIERLDRLEAAAKKEG